MDRMDAGRAIGLLTTGFPTYPVDEATSELYVQALAENVHDAAVAYAVVQDWIMGRITFPKVAELLDECRAEEERRKRRAAAIERGKKGAAAQGMESCTACHGTGLEWHESSEDIKKRHSSYAALEEVLPCRVCRPADHKHWAEGHIRSDHDFTVCEWVRCQAKAKRGEKRPSKRSGGEPAHAGAGIDPRYEKGERF